MVVKMIKQLDELMLNPPVAEHSDANESFEIPIPSSAAEFGYEVATPSSASKEEEAFTNKIPSLTELCSAAVAKNMTLTTSLETLQFADLHQIEDLKINALKFISLNILSFFEEKALQSDLMLSIPSYLLKDLEIFIKVPTVEKYLATNCSLLDTAAEYNEQKVPKFADFTP